MWESRVFCEISKRVWKSFCDFHARVISTAGGGSESCFGNYGCGTVFQLTPGANGKWTEKVLHNFGNGKDGTSPQGSLMFDMQGNLYGTTAGGGTLDIGTVFEITP